MFVHATGKNHLLKPAHYLLAKLFFWKARWLECKNYRVKMINIFGNYYILEEQEK